MLYIIAPVLMLLCVLVVLFCLRMVRRDNRVHCSGRSIVIARLRFEDGGYRYIINGEYGTTEAGAEEAFKQFCKEG